MGGDCAREGGSFKLPSTTGTIAVCVQRRVLQLVKLVDGAMVCQGNSDPDFTELCKQRGGQHQQSWSCICIQ